MSDYYCVEFNLNPYNIDAADLLSAFLADIGFDSFENTPSGLNAFLPSVSFSADAIEEILSGFPFPVDIKWTKTFIKHQDWNEEWEKNYFKPLVLVEGKCVVHATFHTDFPHADYEIVIDPKMAFGTGHHATTSMMMRHLFNLEVEGKKVLDMGTGTGILSILASKLGAREVTGIEIDTAAFENALENSVLNDAEINLINGDASVLAGIDNIDIFLANINRNIILADLERYVATLNKDSKLILSGFYEKDVPALEQALAKHDMKISKVYTEGDGWASINAVF